jgi:hypothetical protein
VLRENNIGSGGEEDYPFVNRLHALQGQSIGDVGPRWTQDGRHGVSLLVY